MIVHNNPHYRPVSPAAKATANRLEALAQENQRLKVQCRQLEDRLTLVEGQLCHKQTELDTLQELVSPGYSNPYALSLSGD